MSAALKPKTARAQAWVVIRRLGGEGAEFSPADVFKGMRGGKRGTQHNVQRYMAGLSKAGVLRVTAKARGKAAAYCIANDPGEAAPSLKVDGTAIAPAAAGNHARPKSQRATVWAAIRAFGQRRDAFAAWDILSRIPDAQTPSGLASVRTYLSILAASGFLTRVSTGTQQRNYRVVRDSGPLHPVPRDRTVYDRNTGKEYAREVMG